MHAINETHDRGLTSWVDSANSGVTDFPIQNLPFGVFRRDGKNESFRGGVAIGENASVASLSIVIRDVPKNYLVDSVVLFSRALTETYRKQRDL